MLASLLPGQEAVFTPPFTLKVFSMTGFELDATGTNADRRLVVGFRHANSRRKMPATFTPLTQANLQATRFDHLSFCYFDIVFRCEGTDNAEPVNIYDLTFTGDFQNVTNAYKRMNRFGFRSDCDYSELSCQGELPGDPFDSNIQCANSLFKPYEAIKTVRLFDKFANDVNDIFGWDVDYYRVEPDNNGRDVFLHEYGTLSYAEKKVIKILPPKNKFPDSALSFNSSYLGLLDVPFEVHIVRNEFHRVFGEEFRPSSRDLIHICQINKLFKVEHAQNTRTFMNAYFYYKVGLTKADNNLAVANIDEMAPLSDLIKNNSLQGLMQEEVEEAIKVVAEKPTQANLSTEKIRLQIKAPIVHYELLNGSQLISKDYYNLTSLDRKEAVVYNATDSNVPAGEDRCLTGWFNLQTGKVNTEFNLISNYNADGEGYKVSIMNGEVELDWFGTPYSLPITVQERVWYGIVVNINQREGKFEYALYERAMNSDYNHLHLRQSQSRSFEQAGWSGTSKLTFNGSPMFYTNIRLYKTVIPAEQHLKALSQNTIKDTSKLIVADNANRKVIVPSYKY